MTKFAAMTLPFTKASSRWPTIEVADGTLEALKWLAVALMTGDHANKYLLNGTIPWLFDAGRLVVPIFAFVLAYNLARPGVLKRGAAGRTQLRLAVFGLLATPAYIAMGGGVADMWPLNAVAGLFSGVGLLGSWWPLNILFTLFIATAAIDWVRRGDAVGVTGAAIVVLIGGSAVEYWWPAIGLLLGFWRYVQRPSAGAALLIVGACAALWFVNRNFWAMAALPLVFAAGTVQLRAPRVRWFFYGYYPLHLSAIWVIRLQMAKAGYLFF